MKTLSALVVVLIAGSMLALRAPANEPPPAPAPAPTQEPPAPPAPPAPPPATLGVRSIQYHGALSDAEARFTVDLDVELSGGSTGGLSLFDGELAVLTTKLPDHLQLARDGGLYKLTCAKPGRHKLTLEFVAKITRKEPWNQVSFTGPESAIGSVAIEAAGANTDLQLLSGTVLESESLPDRSRVRAYLGADRVVSARWQSRAAEIARKALLTSDTAVTVQITPAVIKYNTRIRYDIVQGHAPRLVVALPAGHALTRVQGDQIRDWQLATTGEMQQLTIEFIKALEKSYTLTLLTEQPVAVNGQPASIVPPQPVEVERESGSLTMSAEDVLVETDSVASLRQINAPSGALAAYQFHGRPFTLACRLRRIEPVITVADRLTARIEESRLVSQHRLALNIEKAGVYQVELMPPSGWLVAEVTGEGVEGWTARAGVVRVTFAARALGARVLSVQLEQAWKEIPATITLLPIRVKDATRQTAHIGVAAVAGIQLRTQPEGVTGLRELPIQQLPNRTDETLAFAAEQAEWKLTVAPLRQEARVTAEVFNLVTIGDGLVGGSAVLRYAIVNQGAQELRVQTPAVWKNVDFTGPIIRRKEETKTEAGSLWTITLQEKAWGGYTLVITYDMQFDPREATLPVGGARALGVERETGAVAVTSTANQQLAVAKADAALRRVDESELEAADRALIARPVLIAYRYSSAPYELAVHVKRFPEVAGLQAVADRTQLTTVMTKEGDMMTQASFMVKNNEKQFQRFSLPAGARLWSCFVNNQPVKPEQDGNDVLVSLPRGFNRDQTFAVDIVYAQKRDALKRFQPVTVALEAPRTDMQTTYAEWEFYAPSEYRLASFGGNMFAARGTTYSWRDAWRKFLAIYSDIMSGPPLALVFMLALAGLAVISLAIAIRRGWRGFLVFASVVAVLVLLGGMMLPALSSSRERARHFSSMQVTDQVSGEATVGDIISGGDGLVGHRQPNAEAPRSEPSIVWSAVMGGPTPPPTPLGADIRPTPAAPMAAGIRPIKIEIPRQGNRYVFTKVLNVRSATGRDNGELLVIEAAAIKNSVYKAARSALQATAFLIGLALLFWQFKVVEPMRRRSLVMAIGLALAAGAVVSLLMAARMLHLVLVLIPPFLAFLVFVWIVVRIWKSPARKHAEQNGSHPAGAPPVVAGLLVLIWAASSVQAATETSPVPIVSAVYTGSITDKAGQFEAVIELNATTTNQLVRLFGEEVAVREFSATTKAPPTGWFGWGRRASAEARLARDGKNVNVLLPGKGPATVRLKFLVKVGGDVARRDVSFAIPAALSSRVDVLVGEPEAAVEFPTAVSFLSAPEGQQTRVRGVIGSGSRVELQWTPRVKRASEMAATVFAQNTALVSVSAGVLNARARLDYQVMQGELRQLKVRLPADHRLMRVEGEGLRTWNVAVEDGAPVLTVELLKGVSPSYRLTVETEKMIEAGGGMVTTVEIPRALGVNRETGLVALRASEELAVSAEKTEGLQKVDTEEFMRVWSAPATSEKAARPAGPALTGVSGAYRFVAGEMKLEARVELMKPEIEAVAQNSLRLGVEQAELATTVNYTIKRAGVFVLQLALPSDYRVDAVSGEKIAQWVEKADGNIRLLEVTLKERTMGAYALNTRLVRYWRAPPKSVAVTGAHPVGMQKVTGFMAVSAEDGIELKGVAMTGLTEVPAASVAPMLGLKSAGGVLAYKFIESEPKPAPGWSLSVEAEQLESWVRAEVVNWVTLTESLMSGRSVARFEIQNAPVKEFRLRVPEALKNVEITGANIRLKEQTGDVWRVELQSRVRGAYLLTVTWDKPVAVKDGPVELTWQGIEALGVERETGVVAVMAMPPLKVSETSADAVLLKMDAREAPEWAGRITAAPSLMYRYLRPGFALRWEARRFDEAAVLQAIIDQAQLTTVVAEDGQMMTEMVLAVRNNARQYLAVTLPANAEVWSAFVAGQAVRPSLQGGRVLVPLERSGSDGAPIRVELTYVNMMPFPTRRGTVELTTPLVDVPLKNAQWDLYLPPDYNYGKFKGTMTLLERAAPLVESYSYQAWQWMEDENKKVMAKDNEWNISQLKSSLETGRLKEASEAVSRARRQAANESDGQTGQDLKELEKRWQRDQAGNLLQQQREVMERAQPQQGAKGQGYEYDQRAAEEQVVKLRKAQEIAETAVTPLRVNLPRRGLRYSFSQALQTDTDKAMRVSFDARNTRATKWPVTAGLGVAGFLALWLAVAVAMRRSGC